MVEVALLVSPLRCVAPVASCSTTSFHLPPVYGVYTSQLALNGVSHFQTVGGELHQKLQSWLLLEVLLS